MFDLSYPSLTQNWAHFSWRIFYCLTHPLLISTTLLIIGIVPLLLSMARWKNCLSKPVLILLILYWIAISPPVAWLATQSLMLFVPADLGGSTDAIVVLSRGPDIENTRYEAAIQLWRDRRAPRIFVTGQKNVDKTLKLFEENRIPQQDLSGSACAITTHDEAVSTAALLGPQGVKNIILITDPPHMLRSLLMFRSLGFSVTPHVNPLPANLSSVKRSLLAFREYLGLISYALLGRFQPQPPDQLAHPPALIVKQVLERQCDIESTRI